MKTFEQICKMSQAEVKKYMEEFLSYNNYAVINEDGYLYAIPQEDKVSVLLVAHMDTVHKTKCTEIINENGKLSSPQGIGGDDRCGIYMIMNVIKELHCSVLLTEDEEKGGIGANKFAKSAHIKNLNVNYMIEFDRKGCCDAVYYSCDNKDFKTFVKETTGMKEAMGTYSDISTLMPAAKLAGVNFSCGYYNAHTVSEYVVFDEMEDVISAAKNMIKEPCEKPFEYVAKTYAFSNHKYDGHKMESGYQYSFYDYDYGYDRMSAFSNADSIELELEVLWDDKNNEEHMALCYGKTKADCWFDFFMDHPEVSFEMVTNYSWN